MDDMVRRRRLSQRRPLMAGLTAGFAVGFTPQALRPLLGRWLLQAITRRWLAAGFTVESIRLDQALFSSQFRSALMRALASSMSFRMSAVRATFGGFPALIMA